MTKLVKNERDFRIKGFALAQKSPSFHPHSVILRHSWMMKLVGMKWKWMGCLRSDIPPLFIFILRHSRMKGEWRNEEEWQWFWKWAKKVNSETPLILPSFCHLVLIQEWFNSSHSKRKVSPPDPLCRGGRVDWVDASFWNLIPGLILIDTIWFPLILIDYNSF